MSIRSATATSQRTHNPSRISASSTHPSEIFRPIRCVGNWQLAELAGRGGFTDVFLARPLGCRPNWPADYAIKILHSEHNEDATAIQMLAQEALVASEVSNPHLVAMLDSHTESAPYYLVMPRLDGVSVARILEKVGHLSTRQALWIARQVAEALSALHAKGWLHSDVKPSNIMASSSGHATLIDLGFAIRKHQAVLTRERVLRTTLNYVAPEVMTSAYNADQRSDIYSLGIALFEMLTGRLPFQGNSPAELIDAHRTQPLPDPRAFNKELSSEIVSLLVQMTAKQPVRRPHNVSSLINAIMPLELSTIRDGRAYEASAG